MIITIERSEGLERRTWGFNFYSEFGWLGIRFLLFTDWKKRSKRHIFRRIGFWDPLLAWDSTIKERPAIPPDVEAELRAKLKGMIDQVEIK